MIEHARGDHSLQPSRRRFLGTAGIAAGAGLFGSSLFASYAYADALTKAERAAMSPDDIVTLMKEGNVRFLNGQRRNRDYLRQQRASAAGQFPAAIILSCIDSRAPAEVVLDLGIGDVFNSRIAGNVADTDVLGGMEFACKLAGAKVVLVMGHTACGAVKGAIANAQLGNLTSLLARIRPAVEATNYDGDRSADNYGFVDAVAKKNVELTMDSIRAGSPVLAELEKDRRIKIVGSMYDIATARVDFMG